MDECDEKKCYKPLMGGGGKSGFPEKGPPCM